MKPGPVRGLVLAALLRGAVARLAAVAAVVLAGVLAWLGRFTPSDFPAVTVANLLGGMAMLALLWWLHQSSRGTGAGRTLRWLALAALALQLALGAGMVLANFPLLLVLLHNLCAALLLGTTAGLYWQNSATREET